jgi:hypothetical protein
MKKIKLSEQFSFNLEFFSPIGKNHFSVSCNLDFNFRKGYFAIDLDVMGLNVWFSYRSKEELVRHRKFIKSFAKEIKDSVKEIKVKDKKK